VVPPLVRRQLICGRPPRLPLGECGARCGILPLSVDRQRITDHPTPEGARSEVRQTPRGPIRLRSEPPVANPLRSISPPRRSTPCQRAPVQFTDRRSVSTRGSSRERARPVGEMSAVDVTDVDSQRALRRGGEFDVNLTDAGKSARKSRQKSGEEWRGRSNIKGVCPLNGCCFHDVADCQPLIGRVDEAAGRSDGRAADHTSLFGSKNDPDQIGTGTMDLRWANPSGTPRRAPFSFPATRNP
jgi:hypothetical protein